MTLPLLGDRPAVSPYDIDAKSDLRLECIHPSKRVSTTLCSEHNDLSRALPISSVPNAPLSRALLCPERSYCRASQTHHIKSSAEDQHVKLVLLARFAQQALLGDGLDGVGDEVDVGSPQSC